MADVGHGCGIVVRSPTGRCLLYDAGRLGAPGAARRALAAVLWSEGVSRIDALVLSHADAYHYNGLPGVLERFSVGAVYVSPLMFDNDSPALASLRRAIEARGVPLREISAGAHIPHAEGCRI